MCPTTSPPCTQEDAHLLLRRLRDLECLVDGLIMLLIDRGVVPSEAHPIAHYRRRVRPGGLEITGAVEAALEGVPDLDELLKHEDA